MLEGEREAVETTYERIVRDPRQKDIVLTLYEWIEARRFGMADGSYRASQVAEEAVRVTSKVPACQTGQAARGLVSFMSRMLAEPKAPDALVRVAE